MISRLSRNFNLKQFYCGQSLIRNANSKSATGDPVYTAPEMEKRILETKLEKADEAWEPIYELPVIRFIVALNKLKIYQTGIAAVTIPSSYALEVAAAIPTGSSVALAVLGISGTITLFITSYFTQNLLGFIYTDSTKTRFKLAYVDFWGKRRNVELNDDEIEPPTDSTRFKFISNVKTSRGTFKLLRRLGKIPEPNVFSYYFGE